MNFGMNTSEQDTGGETSYSNQYDPDREYMQRLLAYEMYGPQGVTGWDHNFYDPYQTGYAVGPHWNYANNPDGPDPNRIGLPPGGIGTGGGQPGEVPGQQTGPYTPNSGDPHDYTGMSLDQVNERRRANGEAPINQSGLDEWNNFTRSEHQQNPNASYSDMLNDWHNTQGYGVQSRYSPNGGTPNTPNYPHGDGSGSGVTPPALAASSGPSSAPKVGTAPGAPGQPGNNNNNQSGNGTNILNNGGGGTTNGDRFNDPDYYSNGPGGPGHATFINGGGAGIPGPQVRPADRDSNALYAGPFTQWGQGGASGNRQIAGGRVYKTLSDIMDSPDLPQDVKNAMTTGANEAANAQFDSAEARLNRYGRTTGNRAGNAAAVAQLAKDRADTAADVNRKNVLDFEQERYKRLGDATRGMGDLYQNEGNMLSGMFGARGALSQKPLSGSQRTAGHGNFVGTNFGFNIG